MIFFFGLIARPDHDEFEAAAAAVLRGQKLFSEALSPLYEKLLSFAELDRQIIGEVREVCTGSICRRVRWYGEFERACAGGLYVRIECRFSRALRDPRRMPVPTLEDAGVVETDASNHPCLRTAPVEILR